VTIKKKPKRQTTRSRLPAASAAPDPVVSRVALRLVRFIHSESFLNLTTGAIPPQASVNVETGFGRTADDKAIGGIVSFSLESRHENEPQPAIAISCKVQLIYEVVRGELPTSEQVRMEEPAITAMVSFQAWPYIREFVHSMTLKMALPPLVLQPLVIRQNQESAGAFEIMTTDPIRQ